MGKIKNPTRQKFKEKTWLAKHGQGLAVGLLVVAFVWAMYGSIYFESQLADCSNKFSKYTGATTYSKTSTIEGLSLFRCIQDCQDSIFRPQIVEEPPAPAQEVKEK